MHYAGISSIMRALVDFSWLNSGKYNDMYELDMLYIAILIITGFLAGVINTID